MYDKKTLNASVLALSICESLRAIKDEICICDPSQGGTISILSDDGKLHIYIVKETNTYKDPIFCLCLIRKQLLKLNLNNNYLSIKDRNIGYELIYDIEKGGI